MGTDASNEGMLAQVRQGMTVVDSAGEEVGTVGYVQFADPNAAQVETDGDERDLGILDVFDPDAGGDDVTERMRQRGYMRIDAKGIFASEKYVLADDVASVDGDTVRLGVLKDAIQHPG
jgi:hypothetical protein